MLFGLPPDHNNAEPFGKEALKMLLVAVSSEWGSAIIVGRCMKIIDESAQKIFKGVGWNWISRFQLDIRPYV